MNMLATIVAKSDQLNADDLIGRSMTIEVTGAKVTPGDEQPVSLYFKGDGGKPFKPGKSMRRVLVHAWGADAGAYTGRAMTLYRDGQVKFGGLEVGGIRISHMSHLRDNKPLTMALTATKGNKRAFTVEPLTKAPSKAEMAADALIVRIRTARDVAALEAVTADPKVAEQRAWLREKRADLAEQVDAVVSEALDRTIPAEEAPSPEAGIHDDPADAPEAGQ